MKGARVQRGGEGGQRVGARGVKGGESMLY